MTTGDAKQLSYSTNQHQPVLLCQLIPSCAFGTHSVGRKVNAMVSYGRLVLGSPCWGHLFEIICSEWRKQCPKV